MNKNVGWVCGVVGILVLLFILSMGGKTRVELTQPNAAAVPLVTGVFAVVPTASGIYEVNTVTGEVFVVLPQGVVGLGTPDEPTLKATRRQGIEKAPTAPKEIELGDGVQLGKN